MLVGIGVIVGTNKTKLQLTVNQNITPAVKHNNTGRKAIVLGVLWITPLNTLDPLSTMGNLCLMRVSCTVTFINRDQVLLYGRT